MDRTVQSRGGPAPGDQRWDEFDFFEFELPRTGPCGSPGFGPDRTGLDRLQISVITGIISSSIEIRKYSFVGWDFCPRWGVLEDLNSLCSGTNLNKRLHASREWQSKMQIVIFFDCRAVVNVIQSGNQEECASWRVAEVAIEIKELIEEAMEANVKVQYISRSQKGSWWGAQIVKLCAKR
jgi:hypothetical protein